MGLFQRNRALGLTPQLWAVCDVDKLASARVMEKTGMHREGILRRWSVHPNLNDKPKDSFCFAITKQREDWNRSE